MSSSENKSSHMPLSKCLTDCTPLDLEDVDQKLIMSFTGHRPDKLQGDRYDKAYAHIAKVLDDYRPSRVISGMAPGIDVMAIVLANERKIPVTAAVPWQEHYRCPSWNLNKSSTTKFFDRLMPGWYIEQLFSSKLKRFSSAPIYLKLLSMCDYVHVCNQVDDYKKWFYPQRDKWMVDNSNILTSIWDGSASGTSLTTEYAIKVNRKVLFPQWLNDVNYPSWAVNSVENYLRDLNE